MSGGHLFALLVMWNLLGFVLLILGALVRDIK